MAIAHTGESYLRIEITDTLPGRAIVAISDMFQQSPSGVDKKRFVSRLVDMLKYNPTRDISREQLEKLDAEHDFEFSGDRIVCYPITKGRVREQGNFSYSFRRKRI